MIYVYQWSLVYKVGIFSSIATSHQHQARAFTCRAYARLLVQSFNNIRFTENAQLMVQLNTSDHGDVSFVVLFGFYSDFIQQIARFEHDADGGVAVPGIQLDMLRLESDERNNERGLRFGKN